MRVINEYTFFYGTKIPFSEIPERIHLFLDSMELKCNRFMYSFEDIIPHNGPQTWVTQGCKRILKDCPELGEIRIKHDEYDDYPFITNLDGESFPEEKLLPFMKKIHKRYGLFKTYLFYSDIDFFGEIIPYEQPEIKNDNFNAFSYFYNNTGIRVFRYGLPQDNSISLRVDSLFDGELRDTTPYYNALRAVLPKMRSYHESVLILTEEEKAILNGNNQKAAPILKNCVEFFKRRIPEKYKVPKSTESLGMAKIMQQLAETNGYSYKRTGNGEYRATKRTSRRAAVFVELSISAEPYTSFANDWDGVSIVVSFQGVGYKHELFCDLDIPRNRKAIILRLNETFEAIREFEEYYLDDLDACFEENPDWFEPSDYFVKEFGGYHY